MLATSLEEFILHRKIDSKNKIWFLLFFHQRSHKDQVSRDYVRQITFADAPAWDEVIHVLRDDGLLIAKGEVLCLKDAPEVRSELDTLAHVYGDPTGRQELLRRLYSHAELQF